MNISDNSFRKWRLPLQNRDQIVKDMMRTAKGRGKGKQVQEIPNNQIIPLELNCWLFILSIVGKVNSLITK